MTDVYQAEIEREVTEWPGAAVSFSLRSKHRQAVISFEGRERFVVFPTSPGDAVRGAKNSISDVRRELQRLGAMRRVQRKAPRSVRGEAGMHKPARDALAHVERAPVRPSPFAALAEISFPVGPAPVAPVAKSWWRKLLGWLATAIRKGEAA